MKKSNWIILIILFAASVFFLWLWYYLQFNFVDNPLDLVLTIIWWLLIIVVCLCIHRAEKKRQERIRTTFVNETLLYNGQLGLVEIPEEQKVLDALQELLGKLEYNFDIEDLPDDEEAPLFIYVVYSKKYDDDGDTWEGEVELVDDPDEEKFSFDDRDELIDILRNRIPIEKLIEQQA